MFARTLREIAATLNARGVQTPRVDCEEYSDQHATGILRSEKLGNLLRFAAVTPCEFMPKSAPINDRAR